MTSLPKHIVMLLCVCFIACSSVFAQDNALQNISALTTEEAATLTSYTARVQAQDTDEPLAFATVFIKSGAGTMTNEDGDFTIKARPDDVLQISYMGYSKVNIMAKDLKKKVVLKPMKNDLQEVTVLAELSILRKVEKKLFSEIKKRKNNTSQFFFRQVTTTKNKELVEAFLEAKNAVNLRDMIYLTGRHGRMVQGVIARPLIADMNFHYPFMLGPVTENTKVWDGLLTPFKRYDTMRMKNASLLQSGTFTKRYNYQSEILYDDEGKKYYKIALTKNKAVNGATLVGTLFIEAETMQLLSFEGEVTDMSLSVVKDFVNLESPISLKMKINYRHTKGYTEVENFSYTLNGGGVTNNAMVINIDRISYDKKGRPIVEGEKERKKKYKKAKKMSGNMLDNKTSNGFDEIMTANADFVKRTDEQEALALGKTLTDDERLTTFYSVTDRDSTMRWNLTLPDNKLGNMVNRLAKLGQAIPQEKVYVHMDNTCYFLGDTIWYSAYMRSTNDDRLSRISGILYVEIINQDGYVLERQIIDVKDGRGHGNFVTNADWYGGFYELRAYTRWQLNWGVHTREHSKDSENWFINKEMEDRYFRDYDKLYSRVFPIYDAPKEKGKYNEIMTTRKLRRYFASDPDRRKLTLNLYPEGGEMLVGVPCRVAFEAIYSDGEYADGILAEKVTRKDTVVIAKTVNRGRGVFTYTPSSTKSVELTFIPNVKLKNNEKAEAKLKDIQTDGAVLAVERKDSIWNISVTTVGNISPDSLGVTVMHDGRVRDFLELHDVSTTFTLNNNELEAGVNQVSVFDTKGRILADRIFFVTRPDLVSDNITISGFKDQYEPYEMIELGVKLKNPEIRSRENKVDNFISVSIRDTEHADYLYDNATMQTEMLLSSEVKGFIPNPGWFFEKDDDEHHHALDLLMMTQGWRRFNWREMAVRGVWDLTQPDERTPVIIGNIYNYSPHFFYNTDEWQDPLLGDDGINIISPWENLTESTYEGIMRNLNERLRGEGAGAGSQREQFDIETITAEELDQREDFPDYSQSREYTGPSKSIKPSVVVHAELSSIGVDDVAEITTFHDKGRFRITLPKFHNPAVFFLAAADTAKFKNGTEYKWIQSMPNERHLIEGHKRKSRIPYPDFSVRVDFPYPRFVKPYSFYQQHLDPYEGQSFGEKKLSDGSYQLSEVKVRARFGGLRAYSDSLPAIIVDGYEAYNHALDAGMRHATPTNILRSYVGDYGSPRPYASIEIWHLEDMPNILVKEYRLVTRQGASTLERMFSGNTINEDSLYLRHNLESHDYVIPTIDEREPRLEKIEKYAIYTDYQPRLIGSRRYQGGNLPISTNTYYCFLNDAERHMYRDRRYVFDGIATPAEFYNPDYSKRELPETPADYRRTLYWNPELKLDEKGSATIQFWNNSNINQISVQAEGINSEGVVLSGSKR